jgi:hypothetical protein
MVQYLGCGEMRCLASECGLRTFSTYPMSIFIARENLSCDEMASA